MKKIVSVSFILLLFCSVLHAEDLIFAAGISHQNPNGAFALHSNYALNLGGGMELVKDLYGVVKFTLPSKYNSQVYPLIVNINGVDDTLNFDQFTAFDIEIVGHYILPVFPLSKVNPKFFGGLGLHWLYNSQQKSGELNVQFNGIGPEFGLGAVYRPAENLSIDFTFSVKFPYYNEYKRQNLPKVAVGLDEQIIAFNLSLFYLIPVGSDNDGFEW